ncbi:Homoserine kinase [hydrothermal vent metagenome]|uniref:Homoserine kinase n=1 Tax=hydrothermal vent metagenome TaxID=652676 RepID=A0A3B1BD45_9ZZZZ
MSVYTRVERIQLEEFLQNYDLGSLVEQQGISDGIENTNYFVTTSSGKYVLTLFESLGAEELPFFLDLMAFLADHNVPGAHPLADRDGSYLRTLNERPAALVDRLPGTWVPFPSIAQCAAIGAALGRLHREGQDFRPQRENNRGPKWWWQTAERVISHLSEADAGMLRAELSFQSSHRKNSLPRGVIHADLFRDNALFQGDKLTGVIDFYYACTDVLLYDLAVTTNDWCSNEDGSLNQSMTQALLKAYITERPLSDQEQQDWPVMLRAGALRFWLSRLQDKLFPRPGEMAHIKDPEEYARVLRDRIACNEQRNTYLG